MIRRFSRKGSQVEIRRRARTREALRESRDRLRLAVDAAELATWDYDFRSGAFSWNDRCTTLWGLPPSATGDRNLFLSGVHPEDRARVDQFLRDATGLQDGGARGVTFRTIGLTDGVERWVSGHVRVLFDDAGQPARLIGAAFDVTEGKLLERELLFKKMLLESQSEAAIDGILVVDSAGRMISYNRRFVELWRIPADVVAGGSDEAAISSVLHKLVAPEQFVARIRYLYSHPEEESQDELSLKDGRTFDRYSTGLRNAEGIYYGRVWYFRDVTERKRQEEELRERTARLEEALYELNTFAYTVAHDLRAPLRAMVGFSDMIQADHSGTFDPVAHDYIRRISDAARRMDKLIQDLLTYSRLTRDVMPLEEVELGPLVSEVLAHFDQEFRERKALVRVSGELPFVWCHRVALGQVLSNLVSNAVKFVAPGVGPEVEIGAEKKRGRFRLWIQDNGIGIAPEHQERIFGVFQRLHSLADYPGTGIGLAIVKRAMERMGGRVGVESALGKGSRFWIEFKERA
jgi:PAS domain S-box-containing protein